MCVGGASCCCSHISSHNQVRVTGQAPVTLEWEIAPGKNVNRPKVYAFVWCSTRDTAEGVCRIHTAYEQPRMFSIIFSNISAVSLIVKGSILIFTSCVITWSRVFTDVLLFFQI